MVPCDASGYEYTEADDKFVDDPSDLVGGAMHFKVKIVSCHGLPNKYAVRVQVMQEVGILSLTITLLELAYFILIIT